MERDTEAAGATAAYLQHLSDQDLALLASAAGWPEPAGDHRRALGARPGRLAELLARPQLFEEVFVRRPPGGPLVSVSPFLAFAVAVERAAVDLEGRTHVSEWLGPRMRAPVFGVAELQEFLSSRWRRFFLAELLASYTRVASGPVFVPTRRGWRRQRFSELDPVRMAGLLEVTSEAEHPGIYRRLGDLALFLTGVFPDSTARRGFGPIEEARLRRAAGDGGEQLPGPTAEAMPPMGQGPVMLLEELGRRWYRRAWRLIPAPQPATAAVLGEMPERFGQARRVLNFVTEQYLFGQRQEWFGTAG